MMFEGNTGHFSSLVFILCYVKCFCYNKIANRSKALSGALRNLKIDLGTG
jgi:hypothetical protein